MPQLKDILKNREKKGFVKKDYRAWDLSGSGASLPEEITELSDNNSKPAKITNLKHSPKKTPPQPPKIEAKVIEEQLENNKGTEREQLGNKKGTIRKQLESNKETIKEQLGNKDLLKNISNLTGIQARVFYYVLELCNLNQTNNTKNFTTKDLSQYVQCSPDTAKVSLKRLLNKGIIIRNKGKTARGGYLNISLTDEIKAAGNLFLNKDVSQPTIARNINFIGEQLGNNSIHSSSNINTTTKKTKPLPEEWQSLDFEDLRSIGFTVTQLKQLIDKNEPELVQESIYHFAFGYQKNPNKYPHPLNVLMGVLRKGQGWSEPGYISPKEKAQQELLERKKAELARLDKMAAELFDVEYSSWEKSKTKEELDALVPADMRKREGFRQATLRNYFKEQVLTSKN